MPVVNPGIRRYIGSAIQRLFNSASFSAPLTHSLTLERGTGTATLTRATTATFKDHEGVLRTVPAGCARFTGARMVRNLQSTSSEPTSGWTAAGATPPTVTYTTLDGTGAVSIAFPVVAAGFVNSRVNGPTTSVSWVQNSTKIAYQCVLSLSRALTGTEALTLYLSGTSSVDDVVVFNSGYCPTSATDKSSIKTFVNPSFTGTIGVYVYVSGAIVGSPVTLTLTQIQWEDITGRTDQTTPSEYVSVGVLSAPYHGAGVDGVKYFDTDLSGNPIAASTLKGYLSEPAATNLCLQSQDLATTWTNNNTTESVNAAVAPDGTTTADKLVEAATTSTHTIYNTIAGTSGVYTTSVYLKAGERTWAYITDGNSVTATAWFDLANGVVGTVSGTGTPSAKITSIGNGWYRCSMTFTATRRLPT